MAVDLCHSDKKLDLTETWSSAFFTILKAALGETRTRYGWLRPIASYELAHTMVQQLQECPCRCQISGDVVCRLHVSCGDKRENLGVVVPVDGGFGLDTKLPVKRLGEGKMEFTLIPKHEVLEGTFVPIYPEEPFAYIERLKEAYLVRKGEQVGVMFKNAECEMQNTE